MYKCKYFTIKELVHPELLKILPEATLWVIFDERILRAADIVRELYGPCTINTKSLDSCGFVPFSSDREAKFSPHKFARGLDMHISSIENEAAKIVDYAQRKKFKAKEYNKVRERLMLDHRFDKLNFEYKNISNPDGITWLHIDTYNRQNRVFNA